MVGAQPQPGALASNKCSVPPASAPCPAPHLPPAPKQKRNWPRAQSADNERPRLRGRTAPSPRGKGRTRGRTQLAGAAAQTPLGDGGPERGQRRGRGRTEGRARSPSRTPGGVGTAASPRERRSLRLARRASRAGPGEGVTWRTGPRVSDPCPASLAPALGRGRCPAPSSQRCHYPKPLAPRPSAGAATAGVRSRPRGSTRCCCRRADTAPAALAPRGSPRRALPAGRRMSRCRRIPALRHFPIARTPTGAAGFGTACTVRRARAAAIPSGGSSPRTRHSAPVAGPFPSRAFPTWSRRRWAGGGRTGAGTGLSPGRGVPGARVRRSPVPQKAEVSPSRHRQGIFPVSRTLLRYGTPRAMPRPRLPRQSTRRPLGGFGGKRQHKVVGWQ